MPKILILSNKVPYPSKDGSSIAMARLLENLLEMGNYHITYGALNTAKHRKNLDDFPRQILDQIELKTFEEDTSPTPMNGLYNLLLTNKPFNTIRFYVHSMVNWLQGMQAGQFDFVILEGAFMGDYLPLAKIIGKKVVLRSHNLEHVIWERSIENSSMALKKLYFTIQANRLRRFEQRLTRLVDSVWSISPVDSFWFKALNRETHFVPVSIQSRPIDFDIAPNKCFFLGALDWLPNLEAIEWFLKDVWPRVNNLDPSIEFHLAGNNTPKHIHRLKAHNLFVHGRVPSAEAFSKNHGISIIPLLSGSGVRIKLLENGAYGIPTISTRIGAEGVYDTVNSKIPITDFPAELARRIVEYTTNTEKAKQISTQLHEDISRRFSSSESIEAIRKAWPK
jgi:glycosyltransferase involved in cell wall biosynthesis